MRRSFSVNSELLERARRVEWSSWAMGECYAFADEQELAIDWLENAFELGFFNYPYLSQHSRNLRKLDSNPTISAVSRQREDGLGAV